MANEPACRPADPTVYFVARPRSFAVEVIIGWWALLTYYHLRLSDSQHESVRLWTCWGDFDESIAGKIYPGAHVLFTPCPALSKFCFHWSSPYWLVLVPLFFLDRLLFVSGAWMRSSREEGRGFVKGGTFLNNDFTTGSKRVHKAIIITEEFSAITLSCSSLRLSFTSLLHGCPSQP